MRRSISSNCGELDWRPRSATGNSFTTGWPIPLLDLLAALHLIGERNLSEVQVVLNGYFHDRDAMEAISRTELLKRSRAGAVTILDVRPHDEFALAHVAGAVNIPMSDLEKRIAELDPSIEIIAYCRGPYCVFSFEAVSLLRARGFRIRRLEDGLPEWQAAGMPVEQIL
jgi:rhodanese-related sulfurtransferase